MDLSDSQQVTRLSFDSQSNDSWRNAGAVAALSSAKKKKQ